MQLYAAGPGDIAAETVNLGNVVAEPHHFDTFTALERGSHSCPGPLLYAYAITYLKISTQFAARATAKTR
jgi:hypothetical protein